MRTIILCILIAAVSVHAEPRRSDSVNLASPLDIPLYLAGNFGELRRDHFHSGIDFKTQGRTGFKVKSVDDGYVSRATVSPWGFGRAVYVTHPATGLTTVYGHLEAFSPDIDSIVRNRQYEQETFNIDLEFSPELLPVKRGETIGISGNAGSSGGPHLHFDVRDTDTGDALDPLEYYRTRIKDNVRPQVRGLALYPRPGGIVESSTLKGAYREPQGTPVFNAWGKVVPGIKAYDRMTDTQNIYGVKYLTLILDGNTVYNRVIDRSPFETTKGVHSLIDNNDLAKSNSWYMITEIPASAPLGAMVSATDNGVITIDEERDYSFTWILRDEHGNVTRQPFIVRGRRTPVPGDKAFGQLMLWNADNVYDDGENLMIELPSGALFDNTFIDVSVSPSTGEYLSRTVKIGDDGIYFVKPFTLSLRIENDTLASKNQYCLVRLNGSRKTAVKTTWSPDGWIEAQPTRPGRYVLTVDNKNPVITPLNKERWKSSGEIRFKITDDLSGVESWRGEIDGKYALFELDGKTSVLSFKIDSHRFPGKNHSVSLTVTDACGNSTRYTADI